MKHVFTIIIGMFFLVVNASGGDSLKIDSRWHNTTTHNLSYDGKWVFFNQFQEGQKARQYIIQTETKKRVLLQNGPEYKYLKESILMSKKADTITLMHLEKGTQTIITGVKDFKYLGAFNRYVMLTEEGTLKIGSIQNMQITILKNIPEVEKYILHENSGKIMVQSALHNQSSIIKVIDVSTQKESSALELQGVLTQCSWSHQGHMASLLVTQANRPKIYLYNANKNEFRNIQLPDFEPNARQITTTFLSNEDLLLHHFEQVAFHPQHAEIVDIWNGNDVNLEKKIWEKSGDQFQSVYYVYRYENDELTHLSNKVWEEYVSIGNPSKFLFFDSKKLTDYLDFHSPVALHSFHQNSYQFLDTLPRFYQLVSASPDGNNFAYLKNGKWYFLSDRSDRKLSFSTSGEQTAIYWILGSDWVYILGKQKLWKAHLASEKIEQIFQLTIPDGELKVLNSHTIKDAQIRLFSPEIHYFDKEEPLILSVFNSSLNEYSLIKIKNGKQQEIISNNPNRVEKVLWSNDYETFVYTEENFNMPPRTKVFKNKISETLIEPDLATDLYDWRKQKIIDFSDKYGRELKGFLFYPKDYDSTRKYPMITHIYQKQFDKANRFEMPDLVNYMGFSYPIYLEQGYFVFYPDTYVSKEGPGISAVDCVTRGVNQVLNELPSIDRSKLGLVGTSFGGYETTFIISQTSLFSAAIAGAARTDMVSATYSYSYNFGKPNYFKSETGQYEMGGSFWDNQEKYLKNSPILFADKVKTPLLMWTGLEDMNVHWEQTRHFYIALKRYNKAQIALFYKNEGHSLIHKRQAQDLTNRSLDWFDYYLKDKKNIAWIHKGVNEP